MAAVLNWIALVLAIFTVTGLLLSRDWRWSLGLLAAQYLSVFWLVHAHLPVSMAAVKLVTGWMVCAMLGITQRNSSGDNQSEASWPQGRLFRLFVAGLALIVTFALAVRATNWLNLTLPVAWGSLIMICVGLFHLGISVQPFRVILGLLTILAGFEILYVSVEGSVLVAGLLAVVNLGLGLTGAYFLNAPSVEENK